ncbi:hypothetical protein [Terriglobus roseus]|uniref:Dolichyl-phosphate-mannose-protein mannosyltransferase n=1 Tax=Terriglobus roseus TaxID=392734 RepID=A0A1G7IDL7_9BACT|nr:hypothetical protein [Terriglobus roseus]SDF10419.1 hypothetical protein SAMN05444167_1398 [Terriglobus roseus]
MNASAIRKVLWIYLLLLVPLAWFSAQYDGYAIDGDAVAYMDLADLIRGHNLHAAVNGYWHPLYPAFLAAAQTIFHTNRWNELGAYYAVNVFIFFLEVGSVLLLVHGLVSLRKRLAPAMESLLSFDLLSLFGLSLLVIATTRELSLDKVRTDSLLQALIFGGVGLLLEALASEGSVAFVYAGLMGLTLGFAYLTKSFAFLLALLCVATLVAFSVLFCKRRIPVALAQSVVALVLFGVVAGPYIAALSRQHHRFDFGDSGSLNYIWYVSGTEKMHLQQRMTDSFGSATVELKHPEQELMRTPGVYSYTQMQHGTYPPWFDPTYWNDHITAKFSLSRLMARDERNVVLIFRYLFNHPEPLILLLVLLLTCGRLNWRGRYAWPIVGLGILIWAIYSLVNVEERYVTAAYLLILIGLFGVFERRERYERASLIVPSAILLLFALLPLGAMARQAAENRRQLSIIGQVPAWRDAQIFGAAEGLQAMGLKPGDSIACIGMTACVNDFYWARAAGVRIVGEIYAPESKHLATQLDTMPYRQQALDALRSQGAKVIVGAFDPGEMNTNHPATEGWQRLGETRYYALRLSPKS